VDERYRETSELSEDLPTQSVGQTKPLRSTARQRKARIALSRSRSKLTDDVTDDVQQVAVDDESEVDLDDDWITPKMKQTREDTEATNRIQSLLSKVDTHKVAYDIDSLSYLVL